MAYITPPVHYLGLAQAGLLFGTQTTTTFDDPTKVIRPLSVGDPTPASSGTGTYLDGGTGSTNDSYLSTGYFYIQSGIRYDLTHGFFPTDLGSDPSLWPRPAGVALGTPITWRPGQLPQITGARINAVINNVELGTWYNGWAPDGPPVSVTPGVPSPTSALGAAPITAALYACPPGYPVMNDQVATDPPASGLLATFNGHGVWSVIGGNPLDHATVSVLDSASVPFTSTLYDGGVDPAQFVYHFTLDVPISLLGGTVLDLFLWSPPALGGVPVPPPMSTGTGSGTMHVSSATSRAVVSVDQIFTAVQYPDYTLDPVLPPTGTTPNLTLLATPGPQQLHFEDI